MGPPPTMNTSKDSRRDPRAKILSLTVRYKSATVAEFIEDHSYDVSRGGMFIRTSAPFPNGTLLKFEVRIAEEQRVMTGVGRVTWRREKDTGEDSPAGMGVKFIKIEDDSIEVIDRLIKARAGGDVSSFEAGAKEQGIPLSDPPSNLRVVKEDRISSRPPPAGDMLDQSAMLLKSAMGSLSAPDAGSNTASASGGSASTVASKVSSKPPDMGHEERATLPTGQSNPNQKAVSLQDLAAVRGEPSTPPPKAEVLASNGAGPRPEIVAAEVRAPLAPIESDPPDSDDSSEDEGPPSSDPAAVSSPDGRVDSDKRPKANGKKKNKKEKKRKKKFRYASIPVPKQTLARAASPSTEPLSLATVTTTPPRKRPTEAPPAASKSNNVIWAVLGVVSIGLGLYWVSRSGDEQAERTPAVERAPATETPNKANATTKSAAAEPSTAPPPAPRAPDLGATELSASDVTEAKSGHTPTVIEEPTGGTVTEELDPVPSERKPETGKERTPRQPGRPAGVTPGAPSSPQQPPSSLAPGALPPAAGTPPAAAAAPAPANPTAASTPAAAPTQNSAAPSPPAGAAPASPPAASPSSAAPKVVPPAPAAPPKPAPSAG